MLWRSVVVKCCEGVKECCGSVVKECCGEVL